MAMAAGGSDDEEGGGPSVVEAWRQCSTADFILFVILLALKKVVVSVGAILYVVALLAKAVFFEKLSPKSFSGGQRTGLCMFLAVVNLLLSIGRDDFGMKVFVGAGVGLIMLVLLVNGNVMSAAGISIFGVVYNYYGGGLVVSLVSCIGGWMVLGVVVWPLCVAGRSSSQNDDDDDADEDDTGSSASRTARRAAAMNAAQASGRPWAASQGQGQGQQEAVAEVPAKKKKGKGKRRA